MSPYLIHGLAPIAANHRVPKAQHRTIHQRLRHGDAIRDIARDLCMTERAVAYHLTQCAAVEARFDGYEDGGVVPAPRAPRPPNRRYNDPPKEGIPMIESQPVTTPDRIRQLLEKGEEVPAIADALHVSRHQVGGVKAAMTRKKVNTARDPLEAPTVTIPDPEAATDSVPTDVTPAEETAVQRAMQLHRPYAPSDTPEAIALKVLVAKQLQLVEVHRQQIEALELHQSAERSALRTAIRLLEGGPV